MSDFKDPPALAAGDAQNLPGLITKLSQWRTLLQTMIGTVGQDRGRTAWSQALIDGGLIDPNTGLPTGGVTDLSPPPTPTGFTAGAAISHLFVTCDPQTYPQGGGHLQTNVYGATYDPVAGGPLPTFGNAVKIDTFPGTVEAIPENPATEWHLWITWVSKAGVEGLPAGGTNGLTATTGQDVSSLLRALVGQITSSELYSSLGAQITLAGTAATNLVYNSQFLPAALGWNYVSNMVPKSAAGVPAGAPSDYVYQASGRDHAANGSGGVPANFISVTPGETFDASVWVASATATTTDCGLWLYLSADGSTISGAVAVQTTPAGLTSWIQIFGSYVIPAGTFWVLPMLQVNQAFTGGTNTVYFAQPTIMRRAGTGQASFAAIGVESSTRSAADGTLFAQYTVKIDVNGYVSGYGLASTSAGATPTSAFAVRADQFYIASPSGPGIAPTVPFIVQTTPTTVNGQAVPVGAYISDAYIQNGTITHAKIGLAEIDDALIANLSASKLTAGSIAVGNYIQSTNYVAGSSGWRINGNGFAEFIGLTVNGNIIATGGSIGGATIGSSYVQSSGYSAGTSGWRLDNSAGKIFAASAYLHSASGNRIFDMDATGTSPVLKIDSAIVIDAAGNASFGGSLTASNIVNTAQIVTNAVTNTVVDSHPGTVTFNAVDAPFTVASLAVLTSGEPVLVFANASAMAGNSTATITVSLRRDGAIIYSQSGIGQVNFMYSGVDVPSPTSHIYEITAGATANANSVTARSIATVQTKR